MEKLIVIQGTNASGKSSLGIEMARRFHGEIVSADSRQVFERLDLGSGKVTPEEMKGVPHHLLDVCKPGDFFSMADFQKLAYQAIEDILSRHKVPFLVGGTGLYVDSVAMGYQLSDKMPDLKYREELEKLSTEKLYDMLMAVCPDYEVDKRNRNRVMRVLEKIHDGDSVTPTFHPRYEVLRLGVTWDRETLKQRIDERLDRRFEEGMLEEVQRLLDDGVSKDFLMGLGLEYRYITQYLTKEITSFEYMKEELSLAIKRFARRQMTWFRRNQDVHWLDMGKNPQEEAAALITDFLQGTLPPAPPQGD